VNNLDTIQTALQGTNVTGWYAIAYLGVPMPTPPSTGARLNSP